jgi:hypothetical protein
MVSSLRPHQVLLVEDHEGPGGLKLTQRAFHHGKLRVPGMKPALPSATSGLCWT